MLPSCGVEWEEQKLYFIGLPQETSLLTAKQGRNTEMHGSNI